jgi:trehalose 6-phosphate phosphatase
VRELTPRLRCVALVSGRDTSNLARLLPVPGIRLIGNHGLEEWRDGQATPIAEVVPYLPALARARRAIERLPELRLPGVTLEVKLAIVSVHFRNAHDPIGTGRALKAVLDPIVAACGLSLHPARFVWEIRPPIPVDKGAAVRRLRDELRPEGIVYIGDDVPDAAAFEALAAMIGVITLAVGVRSAEVPPETFSACDLVLDGQPEVERLLRSLLERTAA